MNPVWAPSSETLLLFLVLDTNCTTFKSFRIDFLHDCIYQVSRDIQKVFLSNFYVQCSVTKKLAWSCQFFTNSLFNFFNSDICVRVKIIEVSKPSIQSGYAPSIACLTYFVKSSFNA